MINARNRFHGHSSVRYVHRNGRTVHAKGITLKYAPSRPGTAYRAAVIVSKKVHKSAVVRNRIRRRLYEQLRTKLPPDSAIDVAVQVYDAGFAVAPAAYVATVMDGLLATVKRS